MNLKNLIKKKKSIIVTWLISYILVLFVPMLISVFEYYKSGKVLESEINRANTSLLRQVSQDIDNKLENIERLSNELIWNPILQNLVDKREYEYRDYEYDSFILTQDLNKLKNHYSFIDDFYVYLHNSSTIISPGAHRSDSYFYNTYYSFDDMSFESWKKIMENKHTGDTITLNRKDDAENQHRSIAFISSIPAASSEPPVGTVVIIVDVSRLLEILKNVQWIDGGNLFITNRNHKLMVSSMPENFAMPYLLKIHEGKEGRFYEDINKERSIVSYISSLKYGWKYISVIPKKLFWEKAEYIRNLTYLSIFASMVLGIILAFFFSKRNYDPLNGLIKEITNKAGLPCTKELNEYSFIQNFIAVTVDEKEKLAERINHQKDILRSGFITRLLKGRLESNIPIIESLVTFDMKFDSEYFAVILICFEDISKSIELENMNFNEKYKLLQFVTTNVFEELANQNNIGYMTEVDNAMACLININENRVDSSKQEMVRIANEAMQFLKENFNIMMTIFISDAHKSVSGIPQAYNEALEAMEYRLVIGSKAVICYGDIPREEDAGAKYNYYYPLLVEQHLINSIKTGDYEKAQDMLEDIFKKNFENSVIAVHTAKCLMFDMVGTMIKAVNEIGDTSNDGFVEKFDPISCLINSYSIKQMKAHIMEIMKEVCEYTKANIKSKVYQQKEGQNKKLVASIIKYINDNYMDTNINISIIGEKFDITPSYISRLFKDYTGEGLLDYINIFRINKAKELLQSYEYNVSDVCFNTGFSDINSFIRTFKKYEGVTPGKYKNIHA